MTSTPTLDAQRTDQLRSFLTVEAAADAARRHPVLTPARRRVAVGTAAALLLAGGLVAVQSVGGPTPAAIAVEVDGDWTTVRIVDIDADPDAVVAELRAAGFAAERRPLQVTSTDDGVSVMSQITDDGETGAGVVAFARRGEDSGAYGVVSLTVSLPEGVAPPAPTEPRGGGASETIDADPAEAGARPVAVPVVEDDLLDAGVRFEADGGVSLRAGTDVSIVVQTER